MVWLRTTEGLKLNKEFNEYWQGEWTRLQLPIKLKTPGQEKQLNLRVEKERKKHYSNGGSPSTTKYNLRESRKNLRLNKVEGKP